MEETSFRREYLNQWVTKANHWLKPAWWRDTLDEDVPLPAEGVWSIAVESDFDGQGHAVAIAAPNEEGHIVIRVTTHRTMKQVDERLAEIRAEHPSLYILVTPGYVDRLTSRFDGLVGQREAVAATQVLQDLFSRTQIRHDGNIILQEHFAGTRIGMRQGGWVLTSARWAPVGSTPHGPPCSQSVKQRKHPEAWQQSDPGADSRHAQTTQSIDSLLNLW